MEYCNINSEYFYAVEQFEITDYINDSRVKAVAYAMSGDSIAVALLIEPIFLLSEREKLLEDIAESLKVKFNNVTVTLDTEAYYRAVSHKISYEELKALADKRR